MELECSLQCSIRARRLWKVLKIVFSVIWKGIISRSKRLVGSRPNRGSRVGSFGVSEYEFSCTNSPNPVFFRTPKKQASSLFPSCLRSPNTLDEVFGFYEPRKLVVVPGTPDYLFNFHLDAGCDQVVSAGRRNGLLLSPYAVRVSDYMDHEDDIGGDGKVDREAEEFIKRFYEQLRVQSPINWRR